jgi:hypothetical protein
MFGLRNSCKGSVPIIRNLHKLFSHKCKAPRGGDKTVGPPKYVLTVKNPPNGQEFLPGS